MKKIKKSLVVLGIIVFALTVVAPLHNTAEAKQKTTKTKTSFPVTKKFRKSTILVGYKYDNILAKATVDKKDIKRVYKALDKARFRKISKKKYNKITNKIIGSWTLVVYTKNKEKNYRFVRDCVMINGKYYQAKHEVKMYKYFGIK
ncbi:MAG: hypothetical protein SOR72_06690 [Hornefia sp.]|nr:hypothetical protein [Hornefia sp.]